MGATEALKKAIAEYSGPANNAFDLEEIEHIIMYLWVDGYKIVAVEEKDLDLGDHGSEQVKLWRNLPSI